jgi:hypothetical protein
MKDKVLHLDDAPLDVLGGLSADPNDRTAHDVE